MVKSITLGSGGLLLPLEEGLADRDEVGLLGSVLLDSGLGGASSTTLIVSAAFDVEATGSGEEETQMIFGSFESE